jgi:acetyl-CoA acetyltransferase
MKEPLSIEDYASSRYIVAPLHIYDYCLVNDGGTALIVTATESARQFRKQPVVINGFGWSDLNREASNLAPRLLDFYHTAHREVARDVYSMANVGPDDISCIQVYDSFSCHVAFALEGFNFCYPGNGWALTRPDGTTLSVNTSGGHLSESYMQGWNHQVEAVRQVRGEAGGRQVSNCTRVQYICDAAGQVASLIYGRDL